MENLTKFLFLFFVISIFVVACAKAPAAEKKTPETAAQEPAISSEQAKNIFTNLVTNRATTYMVSYDYSGEGETTKITMYFKNQNMRYDTVAHGNQSSLFLIDNKVYSCSYVPRMCVFFSGETQKPRTGMEDVEKNIDQSTIVSMPSRKIAGMTAKCFQISNSQGSSEMCYSSGGVPLYTKSESNGKTYEMTATDYSTSVSDSVFVLPAEPQDINAMMAQYNQ